MINKKLDNTINLISKAKKVADQFIMVEMEKSGIQGLVPSHGEILLLLLKKEELTMTEIAQAIDKERSTVTALIEKLKKYNYVETRKSPNCGRTTLVYMTAKGQQLKEGFEKVSQELNTTYKQGITEEELMVCRNVLMKIYDNLSM